MINKETSESSSTFSVRIPADLDAARTKQLQGFLKKFGLPLDMPLGRLNRAFVHRSYRTEAGLTEDNERLEFLGDSVIGLICTEHLLKHFPKYSEGELSKLRASLVSRKALGIVAKNLDVGEYLLLGTGEDRSGGRTRASILGSALEAVCGALYLEMSWDLLRERVSEVIIIPALEMADKDQITDYKSRLQEITQKDSQLVPEYEVVNAEGPDHLKVFKVQVRVGSEVLGVGEGHRKKTAENRAARAALIAMGIVEQED